VREDQCAALAKLRAERDNAAVTTGLAALKKAAQGDENLLPHFLACVRAYATLGEVCDTLRGVYGEYRAPRTI
jgi:methylmalonyl-CoA mutase N-terminal domain/subunit